ncbi:hypothetical protein [Streptomyces decoyicus]|uniref:hypothetical protein n=1 Tax=Streptomyces decoyicus TaxID=249567 RepID=UPI003655D1C8
MRVAVTEAAFTSADHSNCYYAKDRRSVFCEFSSAVPVGAGYETAESLPHATGDYSPVMGSYTYSVWPLGDPPAHTEDYKAHYERGTGSALGLRPVAAGTLKGGGELRFRTAGYVGRADWGIKGVTLRGRVGEYAEVDIPQPTRSSGPGPRRVRVELPEGTTLATPTPSERDGIPSEVDFCRRDERDGNIYCSHVNWNTLRVRIDRRVEGAEGKLSVPEPPEGDTDPGNNTAPLTLEITGTARAGHAVPPVPADPSVSSASGRDGGTRGVALAAVASATALALALASFFVIRRRRARRTAPSRRPGDRT